MDDFAPGALGLPFPVHPAALESAGTEWLTRAFRLYGALAEDNAVAGITRCEAFSGGNSGDKLLLCVLYVRHDPALPTDLFVKFSRCPSDPFRDRRRFEFAGEVKLADLSRHPAFPVAVARPMFADFDPESGGGVLITARIAYGQLGIEPARVKNMDHQLDNPLEHYRATVTALARLTGTHQSGRLSPEADTLFPFDTAQAMADMPFPQADEAEVRRKAQGIAAFVAQCPALFPAHLRTVPFASRLAEDAVRLFRHDSQIRQFLFDDPRYIALAHWNTHIDNAWFWRDDQGVLQAGLLDWGMARQMNVAMALWGGLSGANLDLWDADRGRMLALFLHEHAAAGGHALDADRFRLHLDLSVALLGLALMWDTPALLLSRMPHLPTASGPHDPLIATDKVVQGFLHTFTVFLNLWERHDFGGSLDEMLAIRTD